MGRYLGKDVGGLVDDIILYRAMPCLRTWKGLEKDMKVALLLPSEEGRKGKERKKEKRKKINT